MHARRGFLAFRCLPYRALMRVLKSGVAMLTVCVDGGRFSARWFHCALFSFPLSRHASLPASPPSRVGPSLVRTSRLAILLCVFASGAVKYRTAVWCCLPATAARARCSVFIGLRHPLVRGVLCSSMLSEVACHPLSLGKGGSVFGFLYPVLTFFLQGYEA